MEARVAARDPEPVKAPQAFKVGPAGQALARERAPEMRVVGRVRLERSRAVIEATANQDEALLDDVGSIAKPGVPHPELAESSLP
jgi:hypothetical protein